MLKQPAASDDFTHGKQTLDCIVLEKKSTCSPHPVAFNSDRHILSGCSAVVCVCVYLCVSVAACLLQLPEIESRVNCERQLGHTIFRPEVPHIYLLLKKMHFHFLQAEGQMVKKVTLFLFCRSLPPTYYLHI